MIKKTSLVSNFLRSGFVEDDITVEEYCENVTLYNDDGKIVKEEHFSANNTRNSLSLNEFNPNGDISHITQYDENDEIIQNTFYQYDDNKNVIKETTNYGEGSLNYSTHYIYQGDNIVQQDSYDEEQFSYTEKKFFYNNHHLVKEIDYSEDAEEQYIIENEYNNNNQLIKRTINEVLNKDRRTYEFFYDERGNNIKTLIYNYNEELIARAYYLYNDNNQLIEIEEEDLDNYKLTRYEYNGKNVEKISLYDKEEQLIAWTHYAYDEEDRVTLIENYRTDEVDSSTHRIMSRIRNTFEVIS